MMFAPILVIFMNTIIGDQNKKHGLNNGSNLPLNYPTQSLCFDHINFERWIGLLVKWNKMW